MRVFSIKPCRIVYNGARIVTLQKPEGSTNKQNCMDRTLLGGREWCRTGVSSAFSFAPAKGKRKEKKISLNLVLHLSKNQFVFPVDSFHPTKAAPKTRQRAIEDSAMFYLQLLFNSCQATFDSPQQRCPRGGRNLCTYEQA